MRFIETLLMLFLLLIQPVKGEIVTTDTLPVTRIKRLQNTFDEISSSRAYQMFYVGVPPIAGGIIIKSESDHFQSLRNGYLPQFHKHYDDYLQYLPGAVMIGLKAGGVEGRSSWGRMLTSDAASVIIMASVVNTMKSTTKVMRPDGSNRHSFPSGHTATAFMTATMLSKEYGGLSPWYSIAAYSCATTTGITRMLNNKHWLSDVMVGAGIGIISTEIGYWIGDLIFKDKGITHFAASRELDQIYNPSFLGVSLGFNIIPGKYQLPDKSKLDFSTGSSAGVEGAWFLNPYFGIGWRFAVANMPVMIDGSLQDDPLDIMTGYAGAYFSYPITSYWLIGGNLLAGYNYATECKLSNMSVGKQGGVGAGAGCSFTFRAKQNLAVRFYLDYNLMKSILPSKENAVQVYTLGSSVSLAF